MIWVPREADGMEIVPIETMGGRETNHLYFTDCRGARPSAVLGEVDQGWTQLMAGLNVERLILAATMLGIAQRAFDDALAYVKERQQFGRPIGSFQALQHRIADLATDLEAARLMTRWVATLTDEDPDRMLPQEASMVKLFVTEVAKRVDPRGDADDGRLRLLLRVRHGAPRPHLAGLDDLRRHLGDPAQHHRQDARPLSRPAPAPDSPLSFAQPRASARGFSLVTASVTQRGRSMARGDVRIAVTLACEDCKRRNYQTNKSRRNSPDRVELRKFCRWCGHHTAHKETR